MQVQPVRPVVLAGAALGVALAILGWMDYRAVRRELEAVVRTQAAALHGTVAAAARAHHAAADHAEAALSARLLESARLLRELDDAGLLTADVAADLAERNTAYRVLVFSAAGVREFEAGERPGWAGGEGTAAAPVERPRRGQADGGGQGRGPGRGPWAGPPAGAARVAQRLIAGESDEIVTAVHAAGGGHSRVAAGVRRPGGGAIVLNASTEAARELDDIFSLASLLAQIAAATPTLAYLVAEADGQQVQAGPLAGSLGDGLPAGGAGEARHRVAGVRVLEHRRDVPLGDTGAASLRIGMSLEEVALAERRMLVRVAGSSAASLGLTVVALALLTLRRRYSELSAEHARAQEALRRRDRLAAMGELAATVAHEIRNPLNAIAMSAQRLTREYPLAGTASDPAERSELLDVIQGESARINGRIEQFLEYARPRPVARRPVDVSALLGEVLAAAGPLAAARGVRLGLACAPGLRASVDPDQMRQVLDNLLRNALEATETGGSVTVSGEARGGTLVLGVRDTGAGIAPDVLPRIFDLYFTTRAGGSGIGLAAAQQIVTAHGGTIEVDTAAGAGTTMRVCLPDAEGGDG